MNESMMMNGGNSFSEKSFYSLGATFGYQLSREEIEAKDKEIDKMYKLYITSLDEIQRLNKLIEKAWISGGQNTRVKIKTKNYGPDFLQWAEFCKDNGL